MIKNYCMLIFAAITPHPPIIIPGIGKGKDLKLAEKTISAMERLRGKLEAAKPEVILLISPHAPTEFDSFGINLRENLEGDLANFGLEKIFEFQNDKILGEKIYKAAFKNKISVHFYESELDHGALVPLYYLTKNISPRLLPLSFSFLDFLTHYRFGEFVGEVCDNYNKRVAIIASGDLSHRLTPAAPAGYSPSGKEFDSQLIEFLELKKTKEVLKFNASFIEEAGECGLRAIIILLGALGKKDCEFQLLNYEGPFGVGYLVGQFELE